MGRAKQFAQNSFWLTASAAITMFIGVVYRPIVGHALGVTAFGQYSFITAFSGYFTIIAYFGIKQVVLREAGRKRSAARAFLLTSYKLRSITTLIAFLACGTAGYALHRGTAVTLGIFIMSLSVAVTGAGELLEGILIAYARSFHIAVSCLIGNVLKLIFGILALKSGYGLHGVLWVFVLTSAVTTLFNIYFAKLALRSERQVPDDLARVRYILKESLPFFLLSITTRLYAKSDILFLTIIMGDKVTGLYSAAYVFLDMMFIINSSITTTAYPMVTRIYTHKDGDSGSVDLAEAYERLHKYLVLAFIPMSALLMVFAKEILPLVFGKDYLGGASAMQVLVWTAPIGLSSNISGTFLSAIYHQRLNAVLATVSMAINISWTVGFIYLYGAMGAAMATLGSAIVNTAIHQFYIVRTINNVKPTKIWLKPAICGIIMIAVMLLLSHQPWVFRLLAGIFSYAAGIVIIRPYDDEDLRLLKSIVKH